MNDRIAEELLAAQSDEKPPIIPGTRTSEFWVVLAALIPWAADKFGIDYQMVIDGAGEVAKVAGPESGNLPMVIAGVYVAGRIVLKYFRGQ